MYKFFLTYSFAYTKLKQKNKQEVKPNGYRQKKLAVAMIRRDMTQKRLAELSGVSRVTITAVKGGKSCSADTARKPVQVLGPDIIQEEV